MLNIILLGLTSLFADFSSEIIVPLLPFFITSLGGAGVAIGLISGGGEAAASLLRAYSGRLADRSGQYKKLVLIGYGFSAFAKFLFPWAQSWGQVLAIRVTERLGKGFRNAPRDAIVSESVGLEKRGEGFGLQRALDSLGAILGSLTVLILIWKFDWGFRTIFLLAAFIGLLSLAPLLLVKEPAALKRSLPTGVSFNFFQFKPPSLLKRFILVSTVFSLGNFSFMFLILKSQSVLGQLNFKQGLITVLLLYILFNIFDALFSRPAGALSDRWGRRKIILMAYGLLAITFGGFWLAASFNSFLILFPIYGLFKAFIDASQRALVADLSPVATRASALGIFETFTGLALIPGGFLAGWLWNLNPDWPFVYGLATTLLAGGLLIILVKEKGEKKIFKSSQNQFFKV